MRPLSVEHEYAEELRALVSWIFAEARKEHARGWKASTEQKLRARARAKARAAVDLDRIAKLANRQNRTNTIATVRKLAGASTAKEAAAKIADGFERKILDATDDDLIESFTKLNAKLITGLTDDTIARIGEIVEKGAKDGARWEDLASKIGEATNVGENRANLIARDQTLTLNAQLTKFRHKEMGIEEYVWATTEDTRARQWHLDLDGKRFSYDDPPMGGGTSEDDVGNPGEGINCRCQAIPVISLFEGLDL